MATNPMQRKIRNSFLLGMFLTIIITGIIIAFLVLKIFNDINKEKDELKESVKVFVLNQNVSSGQTITSDMMTLQTINKSLVPSNASSDISIFENYAMEDKEGNEIYTLYDENKEAYLYTEKDGNKCLILKEEQTDNYYLQKLNGNYVYIKKDNDDKITMYINKDGEKTLTTNNNSTYYEENKKKTEIDLEKEYVELDNVPIVAKVTMKQNTILTTELISKSDNTVQDDVRKQEYNMIVLPTDLASGDYIDIRVMFPNGQDYIVISKKEVDIPIVNGTDSADTIWVDLSEDEILHMSCAIIDVAQVKGAKIYATKYTEAGMQKAATPTYPLNESTTTLLKSDPNVLQTAMDEINKRYDSQNSSNLRNNSINDQINSQEDAQSNLETELEESITNSKETRKEYLDSLSGTSDQ